LSCGNFQKKLGNVSFSYWAHESMSSSVLSSAWNP
jgi:hypothetical protein